MHFREQKRRAKQEKAMKEKQEEARKEQIQAEKERQLIMQNERRERQQRQMQENFDTLQRLSLEAEDSDSENCVDDNDTLDRIEDYETEEA